MKNRVFIIALLLAVLIFVPSCNKDEQPDVPASVTTFTDETTAEVSSGIVIFGNGGYNYVIMRSDDSSSVVTNAAVALNTSFGNATGVHSKIVTDWAKTNVRGEAVVNDDCEILVGLTNRKESIDAFAEVPDGKFLIKSVGNKIVIIGCDDRATSDGVNAFISRYIGDGKNTVSEISIEKEIFLVSDRVTPPVIFSEKVDKELNGLVLKSETHKQLADGIIYRELLYSDKNDKPVRAYVAEVAQNAGIIYTGTPEDGTVLLNKGGTVKNEMKAAVANGKNVLLGVNADFFEISGNYMPRGLCVKEGVMLRELSSYPYFAVLKDGSAKVLLPGEYGKYGEHIQTAVGGRGLLLRDGEIYDVFLGNDFGYTRHPRTGVGVKPDGTIVIVEVDGRQPSISNGASLADFAQIFKELGCDNALNLDGGGSSTFVIRDTVKDTYSVKNKPSDGSERKIQNSLLVLLPD